MACRIYLYLFLVPLLSFIYEAALGKEIAETRAAQD
jgi:hypothetical protein